MTDQETRTDVRGLREAVLEYLDADAAMPEFADAQRMPSDEWDRLTRRWAIADVALKAALAAANPEPARDGLREALTALADEDLTWATAIHEATHYGPPTLTCMTKHRKVGRKLRAALAAANPPEAREIVTVETLTDSFLSAMEEPDPWAAVSRPRALAAPGDDALRTALAALPRWFESVNTHDIGGSCLRQHRTGEWVRYDDLAAALRSPTPDRDASREGTTVCPDCGDELTVRS